VEKARTDMKSGRPGQETRAGGETVDRGVGPTPVPGPLDGFSGSSYFSATPGLSYPNMGMFIWVVR